MNSYDVIFHFMNTHTPIEHIQCHSVLYIYFGWFMGWKVGGDGVVGGFIGWVGGGLGGWRVHGMGGVGGVGCWRVQGVGACTHPPMNSYNVKIFNL